MLADKPPFRFPPGFDRRALIGQRLLLAGNDGDWRLDRHGHCPLMVVLIAGKPQALAPCCPAQDLVDLPFLSFGDRQESVAHVVSVLDPGDMMPFDGESPARAGTVPFIHDTIQFELHEQGSPLGVDREHVAVGDVHDGPRFPLGDDFTLADAARATEGIDHHVAKPRVHEGMTFIPTAANVNVAGGRDRYFWGFRHFRYRVTDAALDLPVYGHSRQLAYYDPLTRLPNRRLFNDRLSQTLARAKRAQSRMALMFIDLDKFKPINDQHGHEAGDWVLEAVARRIESCLRASDTVARVGGDEFLVLLPDIQTGGDSLKVAEKIRIELERPFITPSQLSLRASSSIGIAIYPDHANTEDDLLRLGDGAMYQAKSGGGNAVELCACNTEVQVPDPSSGTESIVRLTWKADFSCGHEAIDGEHRELFRLGNVLLGRVATRIDEPIRFEEAFDALLAHVVKHFAHEEQILLEYEYEHLEEHAQIHRMLVAQALKLRHPVNQEIHVSVGELVDFLATEVVDRHMLNEDRKFATLLFDEDVAFTPRAGRRT